MKVFLNTNITTPLYVVALTVGQNATKLNWSKGYRVESRNAFASTNQRSERNKEAHGFISLNCNGVDRARVYKYVYIYVVGLCGCNVCTRSMGMGLAPFKTLNYTYGPSLRTSMAGTPKYPCAYPTFPIFPLA